MAFRVQARTIIQLGAELISSDGIAFYELIKNAFDAQSRVIRIRIVSVIPHALCNEIVSLIDDALNKTLRGAALDRLLSTLKQRVAQAGVVEEELPRQLLAKVDDAESLEELHAAVLNLNSIEIDDSGEGMSLDDLASVYLTIGTRSRYNERLQQAHLAAADRRVILGEKGIGRLSAMRLGTMLSVRSAKKHERRWNTLFIDWDRFSHDSDELLEDIDVEPEQGAVKSSTESGTRLLIHKLSNSWTKTSVETLMRQQFSKFIDPFSDTGEYKIHVRLNGEALPRVVFEPEFLENAHARLNASFEIDEEEGPIFTGRIDYLRHNRSKSFSLSGTHLLTRTKASALDWLAAVGPFKLILYWFNRNDISETAGLQAEEVKKQVRLWAGGPMVFRDGFRVNPYGDPDDDWLGLDKKAFASGGYKLNRNQLVGAVEVTTADNPALRDQTNREGLRDSEEKKALVMLLRTVITSEFRDFLNAVEREQESKEPLSVSELERTIQRNSRSLRTAWQNLQRRFPVLREERGLVGQIEESVEEMTQLMDRARALVLAYEKGRNQLVQLAGIGLMVEFIGHELSRATDHALRTVLRSRKEKTSAGLDATLESLGSQLKTLNKRIRVLDPLSPSGRQTKEHFDLVKWTKDLLDTHEQQFLRHEVELDVSIRGSRTASSNVFGVKGMITQIIENLLANSMYWLSAQTRVRRTFRPKLAVSIDVASHQLSIRDNGPGVDPDRAEEIFHPFVTSKPPGEGKGLGLYIGSELARYHGCSLWLDPQDDSPDGQLHRFVFDYKNIAE